MKSGALQGAVASPPETLAVERLGWHPLFDLSALQLPAVTLRLVVQRSARDTEQPTVPAYLDALVEGIGGGRRDRALADELLKRHMNIESDEHLSATHR